MLVDPGRAFKEANIPVGFTVGTADWVDEERAVAIKSWAGAVA